MYIYVNPNPLIDPSPLTSFFFHGPRGEGVCIYICLYLQMGTLGGASGKEPICQRRRFKRRGFDPFVGKIPWRRA